MSNIFKVLIGAVLVLAAGAAVIGLLALALTWLLPIATLGTFAPGFLPCLSIVTLGLLARAVIFQTS